MAAFLSAAMARDVVGPKIHFRDEVKSGARARAAGGGIISSRIKKKHEFCDVGRRNPNFERQHFF
jgi:hypothetical protein